MELTHKKRALKFEKFIKLLTKMVTNKSLKSYEKCELCQYINVSSVYWLIQFSAFNLTSDYSDQIVGTGPQFMNREYKLLRLFSCLGIGQRSNGEVVFVKALNGMISLFIALPFYTDEFGCEALSMKREAEWTNCILTACFPKCLSKPMRVKYVAIGLPIANCICIKHDLAMR